MLDCGLMKETLKNLNNDKEYISLNEKMNKYFKRSDDFGKLFWGPLSVSLGAAVLAPIGDEQMQDFSSVVALTSFGGALACLKLDKYYNDKANLIYDQLNNMVKEAYIFGKIEQNLVQNGLSSEEAKERILGLSVEEIDNQREEYDYNIKRYDETHNKPFSIFDFEYEEIYYCEKADEQNIDNVETIETEDENDSVMGMED